ncbi:MAG: SMR family transporter, partial [Bacteroidota bacterium]
FYFFSLTLKEMSIGVAYALWGGIGIVILTFVGYVRFGQKLDAPAIVGIGFITMGVVIINLFSKSIAS